MNPRDVEQQKAIDATREALVKDGKALAVAATGYGKGHLIKKIAATMKGTLLVVVPRVNLVEDIAGRIGPDTSIYCASLKKKEIGKITVGTIQSLKKIPLKADLIIVDEAHNYKEEILSSLDCRFLIGLTATAFTSSGYIYGPDKFWPKPCYDFGIKDAIKAGYLCDYKMISSAFKFDTSIIKKRDRDYTESEILKLVATGKSGNQVDEIFQLANGRKKIAIICANIEHAEKIKALIEEREPCSIIHSKLNNAMLDLSEWKDSNDRFCVSVNMLTEGFDYGKIDCVTFLRPVRSTRLMIQACGRGLRLWEDKVDCLFVDFGDIFLTCGSPKNPKLEFAKKVDSSRDNIRMKECEKCHFIWDTADFICPSCHHVNLTKRDPEKSLSESVITDDVFTQIMDTSNFDTVGKTRTGAKFCQYTHNYKQYMFFGGNYWKAIKRKPMMVTYRKKGRFAQVISVSLLE